MTDILVLVHTVSPLLNVFDTVGAEILPNVQRMHVLDEPLLQRVRQRGRLSPEDTARLRDHVATAEQVGARAVLVTCSTISPSVDQVRPKVGIPVIKIDEAMITEAIRRGGKIGVIATSETTLGPTRELLKAEANAKRKGIEIDLMFVNGALEALLEGDGVRHDRLVRQAALDVSLRVDVVILAQASMARVLDVIPEAERAAPILSSPLLALKQVGRILAINSH
jgi:Asp/Glu/hydantoin racemase